MLTALQITTLQQCIESCISIIVADTYPIAKTISLINLITAPNNPNQSNSDPFTIGLQEVNSQNVRTALCNLRSLFLESSVSHQVNYGDGIPAFQIQIGQGIPLNLHHIGPSPQQGEIRSFLEGALEIVGTVLNDQHKPSSQNDNLSSFQYYRDEIKNGVIDAFMGPVNMVFHPLQTAENLIHSIYNPVDTIKAVTNNIYHHPLRFTASMLTGRYIISPATKGVIGKLFGKEDSIQNVNDKLRQSEQLIKKAEEIKKSVANQGFDLYDMGKSEDPTPYRIEFFEKLDDAKKIASSVQSNVSELLEVKEKTETLSNTVSLGTQVEKTINPSSYSQPLKSTLEHYAQSYEKRQLTIAIIKEKLKVYIEQFVESKHDNTEQNDTNMSIVSSLPNMHPY